MTESAKQDTTKAPAEPAATESAATKGEAAQEAQAEPEDTAAAAGESAKPDDLDETKRKFREALERKHQAHNDGQGKGGRDGGKISGAHGPAASRRNFRRKSG
jgi:Family of unknown function (DUF5302)